jgi:NitT/TauT family transport system ATP-binding protein
MTVEENISYGLRAKKTPPKKTKEIVESFMELVGLNDFSNCWPRELSGGMRKRVDLARAYAFDPTILLMDEPFGSLDVQTKEEMQSLLLRLWQTKRKTMVFVTHDVEEAIFLSKRVVVLSARPGTIKEIVEIPFDNSRTPSLKLTPAFLELRRRVLNNLMNSDMKFSVSKI